jgi:uncharacterized membrane protein YdjX (TVP38/TMEM64 family)
MIIMLRFAPLSYGLMNGCFAVMNVKFRDFMIATVISLVKLFWYVYVGSTLESLTHSTNDKMWVPLAVGGVAAVIATVFITRWVNQEMSKLSDNEMDVETDENTLLP